MDKNKISDTENGMKMEKPAYSYKLSRKFIFIILYLFQLLIINNWTNTKITDNGYNS